MDKYQKYAFNANDYRFYCFIDESKNYCIENNLDEGYITVQQDDDILKKGYSIVCERYFEYFVEEQWQASKYNENKRRYEINFDFDCPIAKIRLVEANNLVEPLIMNIQIILADRNAYYAKRQNDELNSLIEKASIKHSVGKDLINIYFQPCREDYLKTEIEFFIADGIYEPGGGYPIASMILVGVKNNQMIAKYSMESGIMFKSITGLAPGVYAYKVKQYAKDGTSLFETELKFFQIKH